MVKHLKEKIASKLFGICTVKYTNTIKKRNERNNNSYSISNYINFKSKKIMSLRAWEIRLGLFKGLALGIQHNSFIEEEVEEHDTELFIGIIKITITLIYN